KTREMQVAARTVAADRVLAAVEADVAGLRAQLQQGCAPGALTAADVEHRAQRALEVVLRGGHGQRDLAGQPLASADAALAVPAVEIVPVIGLVHGRARYRLRRPPCDPVAHYSKGLQANAELFLGQGRPHRAGDGLGRRRVLPAADP